MGVGRVWLAMASLVLIPASASAQASLTGVVRDASGGVLPGVTVEAASPALIEKVRTVVTDGTGQYRIETLRPGTYTVTFTLPGFATVRREGIELSGSFVAAVNAEMRVGALEETITVSGESPLVDVQSITRQRVVDRELISVSPRAGTTSPWLDSCRASTAVLRTSADSTERALDWAARRRSMVLARSERWSMASRSLPR